MHRIKSKGYSVIPLAFTGIAAALLEGGQTIHSKFRIPIPTDSNSVSLLCISSPTSYEIRFSKLIIIDEASQLSYYVLECIDRFLRDITKKNIPFGGIVVMLSGDFRQCPPIPDIGSLETASNISIKRSFLWKYFNQLRLTENVRAKPEEVEFKSWLMNLGDGLLPAIDQDCLVRLPDQILCQGNIIDSVFGYGDISLDYLNQRNVAILCPTNKDSLAINDLILNRLVGEETEYLSNTRIETENPDDILDYPLEYALDETPSGYPPHRLKLKVGAIIMLVRNWSISDCLCNGTRLRVVACNRNLIRASILYGPRAGTEYSFSRTVFRPQGNKTSVRLIRIQFPFRLAFSMTINKSQGQTFDRVGILLREPVFSHGQLYVAAARVASFSSLIILVCTILEGHKRQGEIFGYAGCYTKNVVDKSLLNNFS